jgi:hypothetical protein
MISSSHYDFFIPYSNSSPTLRYHRQTFRYFFCVLQSKRLYDERMCLLFTGLELHHPPLHIAPHQSSLPCIVFLISTPPFNHHSNLAMSTGVLTKRCRRCSPCCSLDQLLIYRIQCRSVRSDALLCCINLNGFIWIYLNVLSDSSGLLIIITFITMLSIILGVVFGYH